MIKCCLLIVCLLVSSVSFLANQITVHGRAPGFAGKYVYLNRYSDYLTQAYEKLDFTRIDSEVNFSLIASLDNITETFVQIQDKSGVLYIDPKTTDYYIYFPSIEQEDYYNGKSVQLVMDSLDKNDINTLIIDYQQRLNHFLHVGPYDNLNDTTWNLAKIILTPEGLEEIKKFGLKCNAEYENVELAYFQNYIHYSIAGYEQFAGGINNINHNKNRIYEKYILNQDVLYNNASYMYFLFEFYENPFKMLGRTSFIVLEEIVNDYASYNLLLDLLNSEPLLQDEQIAELILIKGIMEEYHSGRYFKKNMIHILDSVCIASDFDKNKQLASNLKHILTRLEKGYAAPEFNLVTSNSDTISKASFQNKYIYLDFFHTQSTSALAEKLVMPDLKKKYGDYIEFVSICLDDDPKALIGFLKENPKYDWHFAHYQGNLALLENYNVRSVPSYYLIGPEGEMVDANALRPAPLSPGAQYTTIDKTFWAIKRKFHKKEPIRVGEKD